MPDKNVTGEPGPAGKPWRCGAGHVIGEIIREDGISRLHIEIAGGGSVVVTGLATVTCGACGEEREWHIAREAMGEALRKRLGL